MKTNEKDQNRVKYTQGNSIAPLPGVRSADVQPNREHNKKGTSEDISELERKRVAAEEAKQQKMREDKK